MQLITNKADLSKAIASIANRGKKLDGDIQCAAMSVANHAHLHGDVTLLNDLYRALSKGARANAMTLWLTQFAPVVANMDPTTKREAPFKFAKDKKVSGEALATLLEASVEDGNRWYELAPSPQPDEVFDFVKALHALMAKAKKADGKGTPIVGAELMVSIGTQVETYDKEHPPQVTTEATA